MASTLRVENPGHATGMAGEFFVMEQLFRLGHLPALTLGNAKNVDILVKTKSGRQLSISVKAVRGQGKWPVGTRSLLEETDLIFVFLLYEDFENPASYPKAWIMKAADVEVRKRPWIKDTFAIFYREPQHQPKDLDSFRAPGGWSILVENTDNELTEIRS